MNKRGNLYSLFVGINEYQNQAIRNLKYAVADVVGLESLMIERMGLLEDNHIRLVSPSEEKNQMPERNVLLNYLDDLSKAPISEEDTFIFYFAGHGYEKNEIHYLLTSDSNPKSEKLLRDTAIPIPILSDYLKSIPAGHQLLILDACRNEPINLGRGVGSSGTNGTLLVRDIALIAKDRGKKAPKKIAIISASGEGQVSYEYPKGKHSWFCYNLIQCLNKEPGPTIDIMALNEKITARMKDRAWKELPEAESQLPHIKIEGGRLSLPLYKSYEKKQKKQDGKDGKVTPLIMDYYKDNNLKKRFYLFSKKELKLGRNTQGNDIVTRIYPWGDPGNKENPNWKISREHLKISYKDEQFFLIDENSTSGTFLNGTPVSGYKGTSLADDDVISLGGVLSLKVSLFYDNTERKISSMRLSRVENQPEWEEEYIVILKEAMIGRSEKSCLKIDNEEISDTEAILSVDKNKLFFKVLNIKGVYRAGPKEICSEEDMELSPEIVLKKSNIDFKLSQP